jgi:hypothetical protein
MTMTTTAAPAHAGTNTKQKVGLVICALYGLTNIPTAFIPPDTGDQDGPPMAILVVSSILGLISMVAAIMAWRGNRVSLRVAAGAMIVCTLTGLPAFFVDVPMGVKALVAVSVVITVVAAVLMFSGDRRPSSVTD